MDYVNLGKSDLKVSSVGFGAWQAGKRGWGTDYDDSDIIEAIKYSLDNGVNYIDTAEIYGMGHSEEVVGKAIEGYDRESIVIATKVSPAHFRHGDLLRAAEDSMKRLNTNYIDLYQLHWPDMYIGHRETVKAIEKLLDEGKIRHFGLCNYPAALIDEIYDIMSGKYPIVSNQMRYNIIQREVEEGLYPYMKEKGITMIAWSPIAKGLLTGKYDTGNIPQDDVRKNDVLFKQENLERIMPLLEKIREISRNHDRTPSQVALNYLLSKGSVVIPGAKNTAQAKENMGAAGWKLSDSEMKEIEKLADVPVTYY